jgi:hypothetical protein
MPDRYFSLYYAPWMLISALYLALPVDGFTIKAAFAVGYAIYEVLLCLTLLHLGLCRACSRKQLCWAIYLIGCWTGISSLAALLHPLQGYSWAWTLALGMPLMFSNFVVSAIWVVHHLSAAVALLLCWHLWDTSDKRSWQTIIYCSLLICYAIYASVFIFLGALPLGIFVVLLAMREHWRPLAKIACLSGIMAWPMVWLYLGKSSATKFVFPLVTHVQIVSRHHPGLSHLSVGIWLGLCIYLALLCINFLPQFLALAIYRKSLTWQNKILSCLILAFLVSTYFIGFSNANNYAIRGSIVPFMVLGWICAGLLPKIKPTSILFFVLLLGAFGSLQETIWTYNQERLTTQSLPAGTFSSTLLAINQNRHVPVVPRSQLAAALQSDPSSIYSVERFVPGGKSPVIAADLELECRGPYGIWNWESNARDASSPHSQP